MKPLNRKTSGQETQRPVKILQFGEGNFLRAFVDWMVDILNEKAHFNSDVLVVQPIKNGMGEMVNRQEGLFHVLLNGIRNGQPMEDIRLVSCVRKVINPFESFAEFLKAAENPDLQFVVSNTTEAGIAFDPNDRPKDGELAHTFPGKVAQFLYHRFQHFKGDGHGLVFMPCELIEKNGSQLNACVLQYAQLWNLPPTFVQWINAHHVFCNTLVDRIVPGFPKDRIKDIQQKIGYEDSLVVAAESFHLWVVEGPARLIEMFPAHRAGLDVKFVDDLTPYRTRKVRILNGAHTSMVPIAWFRGQRLVSEAVGDAFTGKFLQDVVFQEIIPTLDLPKEELVSYANEVVDRFKNPFIKHELSSIALNSVSKFKVRVLPSLSQYISRYHKVPEKLALSLAALIRFYQGTWKNESLPLNDSPEIITAFKNAWAIGQAEGTIKAILSDKSLWDMDMTTLEGLVPAVVRGLKEIESWEKL